MEDEIQKHLLQLDGVTPYRRQIRSHANVDFKRVDLRSLMGELVTASAYEGSFVEIAVADTGYGLLPDNLEQVFARFVTSKPTGLGMGQVGRIIPVFLS